MNRRKGTQTHRKPTSPKQIDKKKTITEPATADRKNKFIASQVSITVLKMINRHRLYYRFNGRFTCVFV